ncbi:MAG: hypothetical protein D6714_18815 [Bacteroidetes bacterium]|nr:MAG: hypothetical protein D6714_18815 [Bacteroidota bacterium]
MPIWLETLLEIIKITIPALIVFFTVYYLMKQFFEKEYQLKSLEYRQSQTKTAVPLKLQAYERLSMFCERIAIPSLLLRLRTENQTAAGLRVAMLVAIQQEFEHNITQQVYVSKQLWDIIKFVRDETVNTINGVAEKVDPQAPGKEFAGILLNYLATQEVSPIDKALIAIKKEASLILG